MPDAGDGIVLGKKGVKKVGTGTDKGQKGAPGKRKMVAPFAAAASALTKKAGNRNAGKKRRQKRDQVMDDCASVLGPSASVLAGSASATSQPGTPGAFTPSKNVRMHVASVLQQDESDVEDAQGGIDIQAILRGCKLGRSVRSVVYDCKVAFCFFVSVQGWWVDFGMFVNMP